jgi:putative spermidine/putrescine transport system substrate-binding protein
MLSWQSRGHLLSERAQMLFSNAYLRSVRPVRLPTEISAKFLPDRDYERAVAVDWGQVARVEKICVDLYLANPVMLGVRGQL